MKHSRKSGAITVEVAIGIALAVIVVLVALGLFSENLSNMVSSSGIANMFKNSNKTTYSSFGRDYTNSQVNVQLIGEQGLAMLRNIANNKAIEQIDKYMSGVDTSVTNVNSIAYLAIAINAIVGSPDICVYMKKDSDKKCNQDGIGGYSYRMNLNSGSITINKEGGGITPRYPAIGGDFSGGAAGITIKTYSGGTLQTFQPASILPTSYNPASISQTSIYTYIKNLSFFADESNTVYDPVILIKAINTGNSTPNAMTPEQVKTALVEFLIGSDGSGGVAAKMQNTHDVCTGYIGSWDTDNPAAFDQNYPDSQCGNFWDGNDNIFVSKSEANSTKMYATTFSTIISGDTSQSILDIVNDLLSQQDLRPFIKLLQQDHVNDSCGKFTNALQNIASANNVSIPIPACVPY